MSYKFIWTFLYEFFVRGNVRGNIEFKIQSIVNQVGRVIRIDFLDKSRVLNVFDVTVKLDPRRFCIIGLRINCSVDEG
jgi:hypothetical protein